MIKIPSSTKRIIQPNNSDLFGNLHYSKSINLDEEGYIKLSSRAVSLISEADDSNFDLPASFGRWSSGSFTIATTDNPYDLILSTDTISIARDTDSDGDAAPSMSFDTTGVWFNNKWHITTATKLYNKTIGTGNWDDTSITGLTSGVYHPLEVFRNKNNLAVGNGNTVRLYDTSYSLIKTLTLPADYEIVGLKYSSYKLGIITRLASAVAGQNQEAFFFTWDGATTEAGTGYPVGSDACVSITPYKSSWIILTRTGQWKYYNGGGFEDVAQLPFYCTNKIWGNSLSKLGYGDLMQVEGDLVYFNYQSKVSTYGEFGENFLYNNLGGIVCFDPKVGVYHRYAPSISKATMLTVPTANVNTITNTLTKTAGTVPTTGSPIKYIADGVTLIGGLSNRNIYYSIRVTATEFRLALTKADAIAGNAIDLTTAGATNNYFMGLELLDYGISKTSRTAGIGLQDSTTPVYDHMIFGGDYMDYDSTTNYAHLNITVDGFKNIGYFVTSKDSSTEIEDNYQKIFCKYKPLKTDDSITIKYKKEDVLGLPVTTPHSTGSGASCTWVNDKVFTTTADLSAVMNYLAQSTDNQCEAEIIEGAGAGQMSQIEMISESAGTYTVTLADSIDGPVAGYVCNVVIDNWVYLGVINSTDANGWKEFPIAKTSTWTKFKTIMSGSDITIEEFRTVSEDHIKAQV